MIMIKFFAINVWIIINRIKILQLSCSTEADSICQLNSQFICIGLQNHKIINQVNGFALIDIFKREVYKIIKDLPVFSLFYNIEKKLLFSAMDSTTNHTCIIKIFEFIENQNEQGVNNVELKELCHLKSKHQDVIVSLAELKNNGNNNFIGENDRNKVIIATASIDSTIRILEVNYQK